MKKMFLIGVCSLVFFNAAAQQKQALFLTTATPTAGDVAVSNRLAQLGFVVTRITDTASQTSDANGKDLIVVSSSVGSGNIATKFTASAVPLVNAESAIYDELGIDANNAGGATIAGQTQVDVIDCTHPLAGGLTNGLNTVYTAPGPLVVLGTPVASAQIVARAPDGRPSVFFIEVGADLNPIRIATAPARRVGIFWEATTFMTPAGLDLFDAAIAWAVAAPDSTSPVGITRQPASQTVNEQTVVAFRVGYTGAPPFTVQWQRSDGGGAFGDIAGANCPTYGILATPPDSGARFQAVVGNAGGTVTSSAATLTVNTDTNPPTMFLAIGGGTPPTAFDLVFSEPVDPASAAEALNYALGNGGTILTATMDADGRTVHFTSDPITNGTVLRSTVPITDLAFTPNVLAPGAPGSSIAIITTDGSIRRHQFNGFGGILVSDLTNNAKFPNFPDVIDFPAIFETAVNAADNYGVQFLGYVTAPVSGDYHFYFSSDDGGALYLSTDENPANKRLIAFEPVWADSRIWTGNSGGGRNLAAPQNQSRTLFPNGIPFVQGRRYYIEGLMKEATGGDNLAVAWQRPGDPIPAIGSSPIPGLYLSRFDQAAAIAAGEPADQTLLEARQATFRIVASGSPPLTIQWYENDIAIPGATGPTYTTPLLTTADSGKMFHAVVDNPFSSTTSRVARLTVNADNAPPVLVSAASVAGTDIGLCFDEALDPVSASNPANYSVNGGAVSVTSAVLRHDGRTVQLVLGSAVSSGFTVQVNNVLDLTGRNAAAGTSASGPVAGLTAADVGTPGDPLTIGSTFSCMTNEFEIIAGGSDIWGNADHGHLAYETLTGNFDKKVLLARVDNTDVSAKGGLMVRETTAADSRNLHAIVMPPSPARNIFETGMRAATAGATAGWGVGAGGANGNFAATHPNSWIRLRRVGDTFSSFISSNGVDWVQNGESLQSYPAEVVVGMAATAHNNDGRTNRVLFRNFGNTTFPGAVVTITQNPVNFTGEENHPATFTAAATVSGAPASELQFQWQRSDGGGAFTDVLGAAGSNYTFFAKLADNGAQFRAVAFVPGASATSTAATLTVTNDITRPRIVRATISCADQSLITVLYNELYNPDTAQEFFNYSLADTLGNQYPISNFATQANGITVRLTAAAPLTNGPTYILTVNTVTDVAGNPIEPNTRVTLANEAARMAVGPQNLIVVEAENFDANVPQGGKSWVFSSRPGGVGPISGAGYMQALPESGAAINEPGHLTQSPRLDYCVNFPVSGRWYVWLRGNDIVAGGNSVHVGVDNTDSADLNDNRLGNSGGATGWGNPAGGTSPWQWTRDADVNTRIAWVDVPTAGLHTFNIWMREDSVVVDKLLLTTNAAFVISPNTGIGPVESPREGGSAPTIAILRTGGDVVLTWDNAGAALEAADNITGPWAQVSGATSGYRVAAASARKFYRAVIP